MFRNNSLKIGQYYFGEDMDKNLRLTFLAHPVNYAHFGINGGHVPSTLFWRSKASVGVRLSGVCS